MRTFLPLKYILPDFGYISYCEIFGQSLLNQKYISQYEVYTKDIKYIKICCKIQTNTGRRYTNFTNRNFLYKMIAWKIINGKHNCGLKISS